MKSVIRQIYIAIISFWGLLYMPLAMTIRLTTDTSYPLLHATSQFLTLSVHLVWFAPGVMLARLIGINSRLYDIDIAIGVKHIVGWFLPAVIWFCIGNILLWTVNKIRNRKSQQGGPGYPPQGVGSPDP